MLQSHTKPRRVESFIDNVIHEKKRVKVRGKFKWQAPAYVRLVKPACPKTRKTAVVKSGTTIVDQVWECLKFKAKVGSANLRAQLRSAQYEYWHMGQDLWMHAGVLCRWAMTKFTR
jgi:hypothetical protein